MTTDLHTLTGAYALDALPGPERAAFEAHLDGCEPCRAEVAELVATAARLGETLHAAPPPGLREQVLARIDTVRQLPPLADDADPAPPAEPGGPPPPPASVTVPGPAPVAPPQLVGDELAARRGAPRWVVAVVAPAAAVVAFAVVALGLAVTDLSERLGQMEAASGRLTDVMTAPDAEVVAVAAPDGPTIRVVMSASRGEAVVLVAGMDPAPQAHTYELWMIHDDVRVPAGIFDVDHRGQANRVITGDMATLTAIGVTIEPEGGSPQPTSDPVMVLQVAD